MTKSLLRSYGYSRVYSVQGQTALVATSGLDIDADGSPHAYGPNNTGLDYTANAGHPDSWWGIVTQNGEPVIQRDGDPAPGFYVSTTALGDASVPILDPLHYVNSEIVPFYVLPMHFQWAGLGDLAMFFRPATGDSSAALCADIGPASHFGEGSIALAKNLMVNPDPKHGGIANGIVSLIFPKSGTHWPRNDVLTAANDHFKVFGGFKALASLMPEYDWSQF